MPLVSVAAVTRAGELAEKVRTMPKVQTEHHRLCDSRRDKPCDCYMRAYTPGLDALNELVADAEALAEALEAMIELAAIGEDGDPWYAEEAGIDAASVIPKARAVLARYRGEK